MNLNPASLSNENVVLFLHPILSRDNFISGTPTMYNIKIKAR